MRKRNKKYSIVPKMTPKGYSDINRKLVFVLSFLAIVALVVVIVFISDAIKPPNVSVASKEIFESGMIRVGVRQDLGNFCYYNDETKKYEGFEIDVCEEVFKRVFQDQVVIRYEPVYTTTKLSKLYRRELDVCIGAFVPNSSKNIPLNYTQGFFIDSAAAVTRKDQRLNVLSAKKVIVGVINDSYVDKNIEGYFAKVNEARPEQLRQEYEIMQFASYQDLFEAVVTFKADVLVASMLFINLYMQDELVMLPDRMLYHEYCIALNAYDDELTKVFNESLVAMKADGTMQKLRDKWKVDDLFKG
jgi:aspartate/glutamate/glutamine transport system substrate-binding protein